MKKCRLKKRSFGSLRRRLKEIYQKIKNCSKVRSHGTEHCRDSLLPRANKERLSHSFRSIKPTNRLSGISKEIRSVTRQQMKCFAFVRKPRRRTASSILRYQSSGNKLHFALQVEQIVISLLYLTPSTCSPCSTFLCAPVRLILPKI